MQMQRNVPFTTRGMLLVSPALHMVMFCGYVRGHVVCPLHYTRVCHRCVLALYEGISLVCPLYYTSVCPLHYMRNASIFRICNRENLKLLSQ